MHSGRLYCTNPCYAKLFSGECTSHKSAEHLKILETKDDFQENLDPKINENIIGQQAREDKEASNSACLHCVKCKRLITNYHHYHHHNLENYPYCKYLGYEKNFDNHTAFDNQTEDQTKSKKRKNRSLQSKDPSEFIGRNCTKCNKIIYATEVSYSINLPYHKKCLRCSICDRILQPAVHSVHDGLPICTFPCYNQIYLSNNYRKGWNECRP